MPILDLRRASRYRGRLWQTLHSNLEELVDLHAYNSYPWECHSVSAVTPLQCCDLYGKRTVRLSKERINSSDCEFGRKLHALLVLIWSASYWRGGGSVFNCVGSKPGFLRIGVTKASFHSSEKWPHDSERFTIRGITGNSTSRQPTAREVAIGSDWPSQETYGWAQRRRF